MRNLKKFLAMALTVLMVVGSFSAFTTVNAFDDVTDYQEAIEVMSTLGILRGYDETNFGPDDDVTRWQMALLITKMMTGKVSTDYVETNLKSPVNLTAFTDIAAENYIGSINYASNNGIVVGTSATTFEPKAGIMIQDVFTMVVRMLGYGSTAMNNNYPWSFIDKAISLGLDEDLPADYSNEAVASRGETAQILYNALTAVKSDGSTLGIDFFNLQKATVVITGTKAGNMYTGAEVINKTVADEDYVAFTVLAADGSVSAASTTYYVLKSAFGIAADANANFYVGDSFVVRTIDGFSSFITCEACDKTTVDQDAIKGESVSTATKAAKLLVGIDGSQYKLVEKYSYLNNNQGSKTTNDYEIIMMTPNAKRSTYYDSGSCVLDKNLNILAEDGSILLHWITNYTVAGSNYAGLNGVYLYQIGVDANNDPVYVEPNEYIWSLAKRATFVTATVNGFSAILDSFAGIEQYDAYSDTVLYDDDGDGDYDRGVYYQYKFGKVTLNTESTPKLVLGGTSTGVAPAAVTFVDGDGKTITLADIQNKYVLYNFNPLYNILIVKEIFATQTGLVTGTDTLNKTITFNALGVNLVTGVVAGEKYNLGNAKLQGATFADLGIYGATSAYLAGIIGKNVNFVEKDGNVLAIFDYNTKGASPYMVIVNPNNIGYTTLGYNNALVYFDPAKNSVAATQTVIAYNAISTYWYAGFANTAVSGVNARLETGNLVTASKDALGNYDLAVIRPEDYKEKADAGISKNLSGIYDNGGIISFNNTIGSLNGTPFMTNSATVFIVNTDGTMSGMKSYTGVPANGATIEIYPNIEIDDNNAVFAHVGSDNVAKFIYVNGGEFTGRTAGGNVNDPWNGNVQTSTIIYVDSETVATAQINNSYNYGTGVYLNRIATYTKAIDFINGGYASDTYVDSNFGALLTAGKFYYVQNGYVVREIAADAPGSPIKSAYLTEIYSTANYNAKAINFSANLVSGNGEYVAGERDYTDCFPILYWLNGTTGINTNVWNSGIADLMTKYGTGVDDPTTAKNYVDSINAAAADGKKNAAEVYYYDAAYSDNLNAINFPVFTAYASHPVFIAKGAVVSITPYAKPADINLFDVEFFALDADYDNGHTVDTLNEFYNNDVEFYIGGKNTNGEILFNMFETIDMTTGGVENEYYRHAYGAVNGSNLPIIIIAVSKDLTPDMWDITFTKQGGNDVRYDKAISLRNKLIGLNETTDTKYYALQVTTDMIHYNNDMTVDVETTTVDDQTTNTYNIDVCFWAIPAEIN